MKKNISFKMWIAVVWGGIRQFIRRIISWKTMKFAGRFLCVCMGFFLLFMCGTIAYCMRDDMRKYESWAQRENISPRMQYVRPYHSDEKGWISARGNDKKLIKGVEWVVLPQGNDSLAVFSQKGKRGYFNIYTGKVVVPAKYDAAWIFSNGVAAVVEGSTLRFIDSAGEPAMEKTFQSDYRLTPVFCGDYCIMSNERGAFGLIDKTGNWVVQPEYEQIVPEVRNYWRMRKDTNDEQSSWYAFTDKLQQVNPEGVRRIEVNEDLGVIFTLPNHLQRVVDFDGNQSDRFLCMDIEPMDYEKENRDEYGDIVKGRCTLYRYRMADGYEGLCKPNGELVTEPIYWEVKPIDKDLYLCMFRDADAGEMVNSRGEITNM